MAQTDARNRCTDGPEGHLVTVLTAEEEAIIVAFSLPHVAAARDAYKHDRRLKTLRGLTPFEYVARIWTED